MNESKLCILCEEVKPYYRFTKDSVSFDGLHYCCDECVLKSSIKKCSKCDEIKKKTLFNRDQTRRDGYTIYCKKCIKKINKNTYLTTDRPFQCWKRALKRKYNITPEIYYKMLEYQEESCAICGITAEKFGSKLHVDHNHTTKEVRGLLCGSCNKALGLLYDSKDNLIKAIEYLDKNNGGTKCQNL